MLEYRHLVINKKDEKVEEEPKIADPISGGGTKCPLYLFCGQSSTYHLKQHDIRLNRFAKKKKLRKSLIRNR